MQQPLSKPFQHPARTLATAVAGADGCRAGWVVRDTSDDLRVVTRLDLTDIDLLGVDMPIGLPMDREARV